MPNTSTKPIILDRDGVINFDSLDYIKTPIEWIPIPRSIEAIKKLCDEGYQIIIHIFQLILILFHSELFPKLMVLYINLEKFQHHNL